MRRWDKRVGGNQKEAAGLIEAVPPNKGSLKGEAGNLRATAPDHERQGPR